MDTPELFRLLCNVICVGQVSEIDLSNEKDPRVRVTNGDSTTGWIRWLTARAGAARRWCAPVVGEQVLLAAPGGDLNTAVLLGSLFGADFPPPDNSLNTDVITWSDGATCRYDISKSAMTLSGIKTLTINTGGPVAITCTTAEVKADDSVTLDAPNVICTQKLTATELSITKGGEINGAFTGTMTLNGVKPDDHNHGGVESGSSRTKGTR